MKYYAVEEWRDGRWQVEFNALTLTHAAEILSELDREGEAGIPRRVVDEKGVVFSGRHCSRNTPVNDVKPVWIVMSLDKAGPCERGERPYHQHPTKHEAQAEARRLSAASRGGRFGVLELVHVVGWVDFNLQDEILF